MILEERSSLESQLFKSYDLDVPFLQRGRPCDELLDRLEELRLKEWHPRKSASVG